MLQLGIITLGVAKPRLLPVFAPTSRYVAIGYFNSWSSETSPIKLFLPRHYVAAIGYYNSWSSETSSITCFCPDVTLCCNLVFITLGVAKPPLLAVFAPSLCCNWVLLESPSGRAPHPLHSYPWLHSLLFTPVAKLYNYNPTGGYHQEKQSSVRCDCEPGALAVYISGVLLLFSVFR